MAKNKVSEWSSTPANNTDIANIDIAEGCAPSGVNNAIREMMAQVKDMQAGTDGDTFTVGGNFTAEASSILKGEIVVNNTAGTSGQVLTTQGNGLTAIWKDAFVTGMIMMWSGTIATIPSGWYLCNGSNGTPDLRNRFVIGAYADSSGTAYTTVTGSNTQTGGSKDAIVVSHTHSTTVTDPGHNHTANTVAVRGGPDVQVVANYPSDYYNQNVGINNNTTGITVEISTTGSSGTNANLPPYFALAFIMKA
jgi:hypothetical protein